MSRKWFTSALVLAMTTVAGYAQITIPGADGSDGAFNPTANVEVDLGQAAATAWDTPSPNPGKGVYDAAKWAVVFKYTDVNIPNGVTVTFKNCPTTAPVVWLVQGNVTISGNVQLSGQSATSVLLGPTIPGPGGFRGGRSWLNANSLGGAGFGPGGGTWAPDGSAGGGSYGSAAGGNTASVRGSTYGNASILPLIGGSGGSGNMCLGGGGAGGGAILIACTNTITLSSSGTVRADGGSGYNCACGGSGGAIRLVANRVTGSGPLLAQPGGGYQNGGYGRIRIEANEIGLSVSSTPIYTTLTPSDPAPLWPPDVTTPTVRAVSLGSRPVPTDPQASLNTQVADVKFSSSAPQTLVIEAKNVPLDWNVKVRVVPKYNAPAATVAAVFVSGDATQSTWQADLTLPYEYSAIQVRASKP